MKQTLQHDVLMRSIKVLDIGYITILYISMAVFVSKMVDKLLGEFDVQKEMHKSKLRVTVELFLAFWAYGVLIYVVRNLVQLVPFPLNGYQGFDHFRVKELSSAAVFTVSFMMFNNYLRSMVGFYYNQL